jgi:hypothetical protein
MITCLKDFFIKLWDYFDSYYVIVCVVAVAFRYVEIFG